MITCITNTTKAPEGTRTPDPRITNALLYQLSHGSLILVHYNIQKEKWSSIKKKIKITYTGSSYEPVAEDKEWRYDFHQKLT